MCKSYFDNFSAADMMSFLIRLLLIGLSKTRCENTPEMKGIRQKYFIWTSKIKLVQSIFEELLITFNELKLSPLKSSQQLGFRTTF